MSDDNRPHREEFPDQPEPVDSVRPSAEGAEGIPVPPQPPRSTQEDWKPDPYLLKAVVALGISEELATKALFYTGNVSADAAADWIFENPCSQNDLSLEEEAIRAGADPEFGIPHKMVFVVNSELKMGLGKIAAQVGHATLGLYRRLIDHRAAALAQWSNDGETKVVLRGENTEHLIELNRQAESIGLRTYLVQDAGRTQIAAGSVTVLSIFGKEETVDRVTGQLKLL